MGQLRSPHFADVLSCSKWTMACSFVPIHVYMPAHYTYTCHLCMLLQRSSKLLFTFDLLAFSNLLILCSICCLCIISPCSFGCTRGYTYIAYNSTQYIIVWASTGHELWKQHWACPTYICTLKVQCESPYSRLASTVFGGHFSFSIEAEQCCTMYLHITPAFAWCNISLHIDERASTRVSIPSTSSLQLTCFVLCWRWLSVQVEPLPTRGYDCTLKDNL